MLPSHVPPQHIDDYVETHILHSGLCDPQLLNHQNVPLWPRLYQCVFCKMSLCGVYPIPLLLAAMKNSWEELEARGVLKHFHLPVCPWTELFWPFWQTMRWVSSNFLVVINFNLVFGFCWSMQRDSSCFFTHTLTSCWCWMLCGGHGFLWWRC